MVSSFSMSLLQSSAFLFMMGYAPFLSEYLDVSIYSSISLQFFISLGSNPPVYLPEAFLDLYSKLSISSKIAGFSFGLSITPLETQLGCGGGTGLFCCLPLRMLLMLETDEKLLTALPFSRMGWDQLVMPLKRLELKLNYFSVLMGLVELYSLSQWLTIVMGYLSGGMVMGFACSGLNFLLRFIPSCNFSMFCFIFCSLSFFSWLIRESSSIQTSFYILNIITITGNQLQPRHFLRLGYRICMHTCSCFHLLASILITIIFHFLQVTLMAKRSIFQQANEFILPQTEMFDFFDYLAGEKLVLPEQRSFCEDAMVTFKFSQPLPKPNLFKYKKPESKEAFKSIRLKEISKNNISQQQMGEG